MAGENDEGGGEDTTPFGPPSPYEAGDPGTYGPPSPYEASPGDPGSYGPPKDVFTDQPVDPGTSSSDDSDTSDENPHVDKKNGSTVDYGSLFVSTAKVAGDVAKAAVGKGLPAPVAAAEAAAAAARQAAANQSPSQTTSPAVVSGNKAVSKPALSTGAMVAIGFGGVVVVGALAMAASKRGRR